MRVRRLMTLVLISACSGSIGELSDAGTPIDAGTIDDAGTPDAGSEDSGAPEDAGTPDAGTPDAGHPFLGASRCADAGLILCEDFEATTLDTSLWTVVGGAANVRIATGESARGTSALHISRTGNGGAYIRETRTFPAANNSYFARVFVKFIALPDRPMTYSHWTMAAASGTGIAGEIRIGGQFITSNGSDRNLWGVGTDNRTQDAGTGDWTTSDSDPVGHVLPVPEGEWMCIEWQHSGATDETRFWWDEIEHPSLHTTASHHGGNENPYVLPQFTALWIGWAEYQASDAGFELWMDEFAVDDQRIGCVR